MNKNLVYFNCLKIEFPETSKIILFWAVRDVTRAYEAGASGNNTDVSYENCLLMKEILFDKIIIPKKTLSCLIQGQDICYVDYNTRPI